jgi:hypothetical protein
MSEIRPNRLAQATSPYLLQHARNPVDWYPWGSEALEAARREDKPIFLSVGYSACHWCHVMERESFTDPETARVLNESFVSIKVDREERPDLDELYMQAVQLFTGGHGGWPMSVFLTPAGEPYMAGTYFPPVDRSGMPGFRTVLRFAAAAYRDRRTDVARTAEQVTDALRRLAAVQSGAALPGPEVLDAAWAAWRREYDAENGGFGGAPKFPQPMALGFLLRYHARCSEPQVLAVVEHTLTRMARGGIHDQLGGGFHRYATDAHWLVPHFEKMLVDNVLLARLYIEAWQVTGKPLYRDVASATLAYLTREMTAPEGGFCAAQDADSDGSEGAYFVWTPDQIAAAAASAADAPMLCRYFGVGAAGNFAPGASVLSVPREPEVVAAELGVDAEQLGAVIERGRRDLLAARAARVPPARDDKVIVAWNGLAISAYARAARVFEDDGLLDRAVAAATFILDRAAGRVLFRTAVGDQVQGRGFLDDHAALVGALLDLYEASFEPRWLEAARDWNAATLADFWDPSAGGFYYTGRGHESLLARSRQAYDHAAPSGNALAAGNLARLAALTGEGDLEERARRTLALFAPTLDRAPGATAEMLSALDFCLGPVRQIALSGRGPAAKELLRETFRPFLPRKVVAGWPREGEPAELRLLENRAAPAGRAAAYVCQEFVCDRPVTTPEELRSLLAPRPASPA